MIRYMSMFRTKTLFKQAFHIRPRNIRQLLLPIMSHCRTRINTVKMKPSPSMAAKHFNIEPGLLRGAKAYHHAARLEGLPPSTGKAPIATIPTTSLLRSYLISFVSNKPYLLNPTLSILSALSKKSSTSLLNVDRNPLLHAILKHTFFKAFCAGETARETRATLNQLRDTGFGGTILTYAKETVFDHKSNTSHGLGTDSKLGKDDKASTFCHNIDAWRRGTLETLACLGDGDHLAMKVTGAGPQVTEAFVQGSPLPQQMTDAMHEICAECKRRNIRVLVDAESQHFQRGIAKLAYEMQRTYNNDGYAVVYNTYQAYLKGTRQRVIRDLHRAREEGFTLGLKMVRGAYLASDQRDLIHDTKEETDSNYNTIAHGVINQNLEGVKLDDKGFPPVNLLLATHNETSAVSSYQLHKERKLSGLPTVPLIFAQLHGMSDHLSFELIKLQEGDKLGLPQVLKCSTWGTLGECLAYLLRRAIENRQAAVRSREELDTLGSELKRRMSFGMLGHK